MRTATAVTPLIYLLIFALTDKTLSLHEAWRCYRLYRWSRAHVLSVDTGRPSGCVYRPASARYSPSASELYKTGHVRITSDWGAFVQPLPQWESKWEMHIVSVCSLSCPACNAHAPYCHLWPVWIYNIFRHYLINGTIFEKKLLNTKCVFWFSLQLLSETFLILRGIERDVIKRMYIGLRVKYRLFRLDLN